MNKPITSYVAKVLDNQTLIMSSGERAGVEKGMKFKIFSKKKVDVLDPLSKEKLGELDIEKHRVKVTEVHEKFCIAETYEYETVNEGGYYTGTSFLTLNKMFQEPKLVKKRRTFNIEPSDKAPIDETESTVRVGDRAEQIIDNVET